MLIPPKKSNLSCLKLVSDTVDATQKHQQHRSYQYHHHQQQQQRQQRQPTPSKGVYISLVITLIPIPTATVTRKEVVLSSSDPKTPLAPNATNMNNTAAYGSSPEDNYSVNNPKRANSSRTHKVKLPVKRQPHHPFPQRSLDAAAVPLPPPPRPASRWKEDWEELELCGVTAGGDTGGTEGEMTDMDKDPDTSDPDSGVLDQVVVEVNLWGKTGLKSN
ncbi:hypothetical protein K435DRAFT_862157 [Dendrothele bispora CBS 962.96]|uniref:Uncharacterized protein n=1 Tax=Dendrothele bispora (strain CBS 962.96) TaxID=1314807 RepID=A0A4S8LTX5_DENBC|nr:hypothetical protein K435DRAFT_862157 [Dendrothele bispora CBS 962.96]